MLETTFNAKIKGETLSQLPHDLYIPPDALEVYLEAFEDGETAPQLDREKI